MIALSGAVAGADPPPWAHGQGNGQPAGGPGNQGGGPPPAAQGNGPPSQGGPPAPPSPAQPPGGGGPPGPGPHNPGHGGGPPGQGGNNPGNGGGPPGQSGNNPGHGGTPPGHQDTNAPRQPTGASAAAAPTPAPVTTPVPTTAPVQTPISTPQAPATPSTPTLPGTSSHGALPGITITSLATPASRSHRSGGAAGLFGGGALTATGLGGLLHGSLTTPLAPGTGTAGTSRGGTTTFTHPGQGVRTIVVPPSSSPSTVIAHFISVIPTAVWIALAVALGLAALGGGAAVAFGRRASLRAGEVAAVTAAALTDQLTGVSNRRGFTDSAERELERARRYGHPLALAYVDVRGLKAVNDSEGHLAGDRLLTEVAALLSQSARTHDLVGRMGGDELAVLLAEQTGPGALAMSRRVREQVPAHRAKLGLKTPWDVTIGTASFPEDGDTLDELLAAADRRMYEQRGIELRAS